MLVLFHGSTIKLVSLSLFGLDAVKGVGDMFATILYLIDASVADYILTLLTALSSGGEITPLPLRPAWKLVKKSFKHRTFVRYAITKLSLLRVGFVQNGSNSN